jgi:hypothetical protein
MEFMHQKNLIPLCSLILKGFNPNIACDVGELLSEGKNFKTVSKQESQRGRIRVVLDQSLQTLFVLVAVQNLLDFRVVHVQVLF